jgi:DNA-binding NtrC family response regulator
MRFPACFSENLHLLTHDYQVFPGGTAMLPVSVALPNSSIGPVAAAQPFRARLRVVLVVSSDSSLRERLSHSLTGLRWQVLEAPGGAEAWIASQSATQLEAMLIDPWLPDLDVAEFLRDFHRDHPHVDIMMTDGLATQESPRSGYHQELLYALRRCQDGNTVAWNVAPVLDERPDPARLPPLITASPETRVSQKPATKDSSWNQAQIPAQTATGYAAGREIALSPGVENTTTAEDGPAIAASPAGNAIHLAEAQRREKQPTERISELIGSSAIMLEVSRRIRLVASRVTPVLIEGPTGSGKELVAEALHRLSQRSRKPFVAINCAAIPEALLESELFGHTRGAFTGAVQGRTGRIEAADGGTLFLDEIGEMPLALQSKLLRFFESGELQRIGDNETVKVDVRIVAATHQPLAEDAQKGHFRADLYYRLAVFLIRTPALVEHMEDLPGLVTHFLDRMGRKSPIKRIDASAMARLAGHPWPGNVRELEHVLERAAILCGDEPVITSSEIDFGLSLMN